MGYLSTPIKLKPMVEVELKKVCTCTWCEE